MQTIQRIAACSCGRLRVTCSGEAARISMCHCLACQRRTGAPFSAQSRFPRSQVSVDGRSTAYTRMPHSGNAVALGMFADPTYPAPRVSVWEGTRHPWTERIADNPMEHLA